MNPREMKIDNDQNSGAFNFELEWFEIEWSIVINMQFVDSHHQLLSFYGVIGQKVFGVF